MGNRTLDNLEETIESPHYTSRVAQKLAQAAEDKKTLKAIEEKVGSPHLQYEAHESEPPDKPAKPPKKIEKPAPNPGIPPATEPSKPVPSPTPQPPNEQSSLGGQASATPPADERAQEPPQPIAPTPTPKADDTLPDADQARDAINAAINIGGDGRTSLPPLQKMGATEVGLDLGHDENEQEPTKNIHIDDQGTLTYPNNPILPSDATPAANDPSAPPPVPPPMMPPPDDQNGHLPKAA